MLAVRSPICVRFRLADGAFHTHANALPPRETKRPMMSGGREDADAEPEDSKRRLSENRRKTMTPHRLVGWRMGAIFTEKRTSRFRFVAVVQFLHKLGKKPACKGANAETSKRSAPLL